MSEIGFQVFIRHTPNGKLSVMGPQGPLSCDPDRPYLVLFDIRYESNPEGFPAGDEGWKTISRTEDGLTKWATKVGALFVGHVTGGGRTRCYVYCPRQPGTEVTIRTGVFTRETLPSICSLDVEWRAISDDLAPSAEERCAMTDTQLLMQLKRCGDDHSKPREVDFFAYFATKEARSSYLMQLEEKGLRIGELREDNGALPFTCAFHGVMAVDLESISPCTWWLHERAAELGGEFDGWATSVTP